VKRFLVFVLFVSPSAFLFALELRSAATAPSVVELYTSEGCSSCPPADAWFTSLKEHPQLFKQIIPMAFHVDYWNLLGWRDRFSSPAYSRRQRSMRDSGLLTQVYTPGFVVNNREWRGWFRHGAESVLPSRELANDRVGVLQLIWQSGEKMDLAFQSTQPRRDTLWANIAVLGMGLSSSVKTGENRGRKLDHDFVVLHLQRHRFHTANDLARVTVESPQIPEQGQAQSAIVIWVSEGESPAVIQAVAAYL
jgi:hypothetical protein